MDGALLARKQTGAHLHAARTQRIGGRHAATVGDTAGGDHGQIDRVDHSGDERHRGRLAHMAAGLGALGDDAVDVQARQALGKNRGGDHGEDADARLLPGGNVLGGVACTGGDDLHALLDDDLRALVDMRVHEHEVDAEGLVRELLRAADLSAQALAVQAAAGHKAEGAGIGARGSELTGGDIRHAALDDGELGPQDLVELLHVSLPFEGQLRLSIWCPALRQLGEGAGPGETRAESGHEHAVAGHDLAGAHELIE